MLSSPPRGVPHTASLLPSFSGAVRHTPTPRRVCQRDEYRADVMMPILTPFAYRISLGAHCRKCKREQSSQDLAPLARVARGIRPYPNKLTKRSSVVDHTRLAFTSGFCGHFRNEPLVDHAQLPQRRVSDSEINEERKAPNSRWPCVQCLPGRARHRNRDTLFQRRLEAVMGQRSTYFKLSAYESSITTNGMGCSVFIDSAGRFPQPLLLSASACSVQRPAVTCPSAH